MTLVLAVLIVVPASRAIKRRSVADMFVNTEPVDRLLDCCSCPSSQQVPARLWRRPALMQHRWQRAPFAHAARRIFWSRINVCSRAAHLLRTTRSACINACFQAAHVTGYGAIKLPYNASSLRSEALLMIVDPVDKCVYVTDCHSSLMRAILTACPCLVCDLRFA